MYRAHRRFIGPRWLSQYPDQKVKKHKSSERYQFIMEKATFGAGCFWGVEAEFRQVKGVVSTAVGYEGGTSLNPSYRDVCSHKTGHAEVVEVDYDPSRVSYEELLKVFWENHDPTTLNRQGPDFGSQYRSVIFYHTPEQKAAAEASKENLANNGRYRRSIVTQIVPASIFNRAEDYHQQYLEKRGMSTCNL
jgi:peptide-methionine (S)-S-oxide reductase